MFLRRAAIAFLAVALLAGASLAQSSSNESGEAEQRPAVTLKMLIDYLNGLTSAWARITQINSDGTLSKGTVVVHRPWRARIEYDPPDAGLIVAGGRRIAIFDRKSNTGPQEYPLKTTPLYYLLKENIDLDADEIRHRLIAGIDFSELHLQSKTQDYSGTLILAFRNYPLQLDGWTIIDDYGNRTHVRFDNLGSGIETTPSMFNIEFEKSQQERSR